MCGICGQYNFGSSLPVKRSDVELMTRSISHRGPDDEGYYIAGPLGLGFRRLSIIDLAGGHQPMSDEQQSVWVVFNGEIYNFLELRRELEGYGHVFRTNSDTEVIIHGYKQWGDDVLNRLNGMFGLAIWDAQQRRLVLARDPFGIKLLYYRIEGHSLYFGSEMRAVRATMPGTAEIDPTALNLFLRFRYTPSPYTILKGVHKLAPGTKLTVEDGSYQVSRWYQFKPMPFAPPKSSGEAREELLGIYKAAVKRQLISDVPVGLLLSGGIDSGLLLALMNLAGDSWPTYTVGYGSEPTGCASDQSAGSYPNITPCATMAAMASAPQYFYSDYHQSGSTSTCVAGQPVTSLSGIFTAIAAFYYYLGPIKAMYWSEPLDETPIRLNRVTSGVLIALIVLLIGTGFWAQSMGVLVNSALLADKNDIPSTPVALVQH